MHEYSITTGIIKTAEEYAASNGADEVEVIHLVVGDHAGCVVDSIELYFDLIAKGTMCENARLQIKRVKPMLRCKNCGQLFLRKPFSFTCTHEGCSGEGEPTDIGREFYIRSIEIKMKEA